MLLAANSIHSAPSSSPMSIQIMAACRSGAIGRSDADRPPPALAARLQARGGARPADGAFDGAVPRAALQLDPSALPLTAPPAPKRLRGVAAAAMMRPSSTEPAVPAPANAPRHLSKTVASKLRKEIATEK